MRRGEIRRRVWAQSKGAEGSSPLPALLLVGPEAVELGLQGVGHEHGARTAPLGDLGADPHPICAVNNP